MRKFLFFIKGIIILILVIITVDHIGMIMATREKVINLDKCGDVDIAFVGSSHVFMSMNPQMIYDDTGMTSVNLSTSSQTIKGSYWLLKAFLKDHHPQIVFLDVMPNYRGPKDVFVLWPMHEWWPIKYLAYRELKEGFDYNEASQFLAFRTNYDSIAKQDWTYLWGGGQLSSDHWYNAVYSGVTPLTEDDIKKAYETEHVTNTQGCLDYLDKIIALSKKYNFQLTFITAPYLVTEDEEQFFSEVGEFSDERGVDFLNYNDKLEFAKYDLTTDFSDIGHLSFYGGEKYNRSIEEYINSLGISHDNSKKVLEYWENNRNHYQMTYDLRQNDGNALIKRLRLVDNMKSDYVQLIAITSDGYNALSDNERKALNTIGITPDFSQGEYCVVIRKDDYIIYKYDDEEAESYKNVEGVTCSIKLNEDECIVKAGSQKHNMEITKGIGIALYTISYDDLQVIFDI